MTCLQPEIMVIDGLDQNRGHAGTISTKGVRIDLITYQCRLRSRHLEFLQALPDAPGEGLAGMSDTLQAVLTAELRDPVAMAVGYDAKDDILGLHHIEPLPPLLRWNAGGIGDDRIVKVQHQEFDAHGTQQLRTDVRKAMGDQLR